MYRGIKLNLQKLGKQGDIGYFYWKMKARDAIFTGIFTVIRGKEF